MDPPEAPAAPPPKGAPLAAWQSQFRGGHLMGGGASRRSFVLGVPALAVGCASAPPEPRLASDWYEVRLPGKRSTLYRHDHKAGRDAIAARADKSASMWRRRFAAPPRVGEVAFSWWVDALIANARLDQADTADSPARVMFGFGGDRARLSQRNRMLFELAETLSGEPPPFATLMYVWASQAPVGSVLHSTRTDRVRKLVLDSGPAQLGRCCRWP